MYYLSLKKSQNDQNFSSIYLFKQTAHVFLFVMQSTNVFDIIFKKQGKSNFFLLITQTNAQTF